MHGVSRGCAPLTGASGLAARLPAHLRTCASGRWDRCERQRRHTSRLELAGFGLVCLVLIGLSCQYFLFYFVSNSI